MCEHLKRECNKDSARLTRGDGCKLKPRKFCLNRRNNLFSCGGGQTLDQAAWGGCGTSILQLFKTHTSSGALLQPTDPSSGGPFGHRCCAQRSCGTNQGRQRAVPRRGRVGTGPPRLSGAGCQPRELPPSQLPPYPAFAAPPWLLPALACPWGPVLKEACFTRKFSVI